MTRLLALEGASNNLPLIIGQMRTVIKLGFQAISPVVACILVMELFIELRLEADFGSGSLFDCFNSRKELVKAGLFDGTQAKARA